ncbi:MULTISPECIES: hypothetical protein [Paenibacillus]|uniref:Lipoprotein n=1 Tax=Paenibacillus cucumis (ex Kampfer et al. 2016) TaxID=1776858 RepID=A0ABS7KK31_9BACL|nr:hypothetical protein [Paenibacillus cucumis (ex Kampfer et al. 2016)]MBY0204479.1 hypothetical protein [Paenibacillus cucumis (ex Kampfer et al. 2016)]MDP9699544.1 hypothetical protein [Paenibacillus intestini]
MLNRQSTFSLSLILCLVLAIVPGCGMLQHDRTPEEIFSLALSGIAGKETLTFEGQAGLRRENSGMFENQFKFEGKLEDHDRLTLQTRLPGAVTAADSGVSLNAVKNNGQPSGFSASFQRKKGQWNALTAQHEPLRGSLSRFNPIAQLEKIDRMKKTIQSEYGSGRQTRILRIELAPEDAKTWATDQLTDEMNSIRAEYMHKASQVKGASKQKLEQELQKVWQQGEDTMQKLIQKAEVHTVYHLTVDRKTSLPMRLSSESQVKYTDNSSRSNVEALVTDVNFKSYQ